MTGPGAPVTLSPITDIIADARAGRMFLLVDDEDRENEGDLIIPADCADAAAISFMAVHGRGLICLALTRQRQEELGLPFQPRSHGPALGTAFTVSIEARTGITTGISAKDRARTVAVATDPASGPDDIATPGHIFPLVARDGGVLVRAGHTEAAVDLARLAGRPPAAVICEVMRDDGEMARLPDLVPFAQAHGLKIGAIRDLIAYRRRREKTVRVAAESTLNSAYGGRFRALVYASDFDQTEHLALVRGDLTGPGPILVRMHALNMFGDALADLESPATGELERALRAIDQEGRGVMVVVRDMRPGILSHWVRDHGASSRKPHLGDMRDLGTGAQILGDLGVRDIMLLTNSNRQIVGLDGFGLTVAGRRPF